MAGRGKIKSLEQHLIDGTYKPSVHGTLDPTVRIALPRGDDRPPDELDEFARAVWEELYKVITVGGVLTVGDRSLFTMFCIAVGTVKKASLIINKNGFFKLLLADQEDGRKKGEPSEQISPWVSIRSCAMQDAARMAGQLGLTPIDRARVVKAPIVVNPQALPILKPTSAIDKIGPIKVN